MKKGQVRVVCDAMSLISIQSLAENAAYSPKEAFLDHQTTNLGMTDRARPWPRRLASSTEL